ncbi:hypothetical protein [Bacillus sp. JCM 19034]|uniref:hypothetical protein n=1 Tax=Bacillus sp. JCM 19034 TaxID=1481928 RepID=UPI000A568A74
MSELLPIIRLLLKEKRDVLLSVICGFLAGVTAVGLFAANGYLISQAALEPPMYVLIAMVAIVKIGSFIRLSALWRAVLFSSGDIYNVK